MARWSECVSVPVPVIFRRLDDDGLPVVVVVVVMVVVVIFPEMGMVVANRCSLL